MPDSPNPFTESEQREIRRALSGMPYSGTVMIPTARVHDVPSLVAWLAGLHDQLDQAEQNRAALQQRAEEAERVVAAGRTLFAAFAPAPAQPDAGDRDALADAIRQAVRDSGDRGVSIVEIEAWIIDNRSGGRVPSTAIAHQVAAMEDAGELYADTGPTWTRWHLRQDRRPAASTALFDRVVEAVAYHGDRGASVHEVTLWIANTYGGSPLSGPVVSSCLGLLVNAGDAHTVTGDPDEPTRWALGIVEQCPDCEGNGTNCLAHRDDVIGRAARSGR